MGGRRGGQARGARRRSALQHGDHARGGLRRQAGARSACPARSPARPASGTGGEKGAQPVTCPTCRGHGKVRASRASSPSSAPAPPAGGAGKVIEKPCKACDGAGRVRKEKTLSVNIPAGVEDGTRIRLAGEGEAGVRGAPPGDLYIFLSRRAAPAVPARRRQHPLPRADPDDDGGARRHDRGADASTAAAPRSPSPPAPRPASSSACAARA